MCRAGLASPDPFFLRFQSRGVRTKLGIVGTHPGSFRKSGKQRGCGIRNLEVCTEDGRRGSHRDTESRSGRRKGWLVSNKWLTIITTPSLVFLKVVISKGFKFFRKNTCRSVDSAWFIGALSR